MNIKRIIAFFLVTVLLIPTHLWAGEMDQTLTNLIPAIKQKINVPAELTEFRYDMRSQNGTGKEDVYVLSWTDKEYKIGNVQVTAEFNGNIIQYSKNMYNNKYSILAKVSYEDGLKAAKNFLGKIKVPYINELKLQEETNRNQGNQYIYMFNQYINNVKVLDRKVSLFVDKQTGEVTNFSGLSTYKGTYQKGSAKLPLDKAKEAYINKIGMSLVYNLRYDYEKRTISSFPIYLINNGEGKAIDAETGAVILPIREDNIYYGGGFAKEEASVSMADRNTGLTPQEQKVVEEVKGLLTKEEAKAYAEKYFPKVKEAPITNASLYKSEYDNKYIWTISMQQTDMSKAADMPAEKIKLMIAAGEIMPPNIINDISFSVDAKTGEILSYYSYINSSDQKGEVSQDKVKEKVEAFLKNIAKDKFSLTKYDSAEKMGIPIPLSVQSPYANYHYARMVNGVTVNGNGLSVTYDVVRDEVTSYSNTWNEVKFEDIRAVLDKQKVADKMGLELMYVSKDEKTKVLAYAHEERYMGFDPFKGVRVNTYDGKPIAAAEQTIYDDIKGHAKEAVIKKLYDSGIALPGKSFKPDASINQYDFLRLVLRISDSNVTEKDIYNMAISSGIIEEKEKNKNLLISREDAVKYIINSTKYKEIAKISDIYNYPFKDEKAVSKELKGYVTLAYGLKVIEKDKTNLFNPKAKLTRADAAQMIYNMMMKEN
ncbi:MAG: hypothetical protein K0S71_1678 [Clostridia bacterium]|jgi:hypothetical protein|nr:hypothetical protein [Clostridia bacterium]